MQQKLQHPPAPECEKLKAVQEKSQLLGEFLDWLQSTKKVNLVVDFVPEDDLNSSIQVPVKESTEQLLAEFFGIDLDKVEEESRLLLDYIRQQNSLQNQEENG